MTISYGRSSYCDSGNDSLTHSLFFPSFLHISWFFIFCIAHLSIFVYISISLPQTLPFFISLCPWVSHSLSIYFFSSIYFTLFLYLFISHTCLFPYFSYCLFCLLIYRDCVIKGVHNFGVFVEMLPGYEGLVHVSELDNKKVKHNIAPLTYCNTRVTKISLETKMFFHVLFYYLHFSIS